MNDNSNKIAVISAIWENPARVFGCEFRQSGKYWENARRDAEYNERGKIRLAQNSTSTGIKVFYNGSSRPEVCDVFDYLGDYVLHTSGFMDTLVRCADIYNISLHFTAEEKQSMTRAALARELAASLVQALTMNPNGEAARYLTETRGLQNDGIHFGELSEQSINAALQSLQQRNISYSYDDIRALGLTPERARNGYNLAIPYYRNGIVKGFIYRNIVGAEPKYLYSEGLGRDGYCDRLEIGEPSVFVEGQLDAVRLIQAGVKNVVAIGGAKISEDIAKLLKARNITQVTYVPDTEYDEHGKRKTNLIQQAIAAFQSARVDGETVLTNLYIAELPTPQGANLNKLKIDADTYGKDNGNAALNEAVLMGIASWEWELDNLIEWGKTQDTTNVGAFQTKFNEIYTRVGSPFERERLKQTIHNGKFTKAFEAFGITPDALADIDEARRNTEYNNSVKALQTELNKAVEDGANPTVIGGIVARLSAVQGTNTRGEWEQQLTQSFDDELKAIAEQPETLKTKWEVGNIVKGGGYAKYENIEFFPADLTVFCAPTSHGKTMFLMQSALDTVARYNKLFLYVSCEENKRQLLERSINVYLDIPTTEDGKENNEYCFIRGTRKRAIKAALVGADTCNGYPDEFMGVSKHFQALKSRILSGVKRYGVEVRPNLKLLHTEGTAESIAANVVHYVNQYRNEGLEIGGVFVDYMQLLTSDNKNFSRTDELKDVCKALKGAAALTETPIILAAQLNRESIKTGIDAVTVANIGEGADIERVAHDIFMIWQIDKTKRDLYFKWVDEKGEDGKKTGHKRETWDFNNSGDRSNRIFTKLDTFHPYGTDGNNSRELKSGYMYVEQMKARDGRSDGWALFPFDGERGSIGIIDKNKMVE